jgi:hypothetical protein
MVFDYQDPSISPYYYTVEDFVKPSYAYPYFYFGAQSVSPFNPPYYYSYGYQIGFSSSQYPLTTGWLAEVYNAGYAIIAGRFYHIPCNTLVQSVNMLFAPLISVVVLVILTGTLIGFGEVWCQAAHKPIV